LESKVLSELQELKVSRVLLVHRAFKVLLAFRVLLVPKAFKVYKVQ
jgi:hypothetical protein